MSRRNEPSQEEVTIRQNAVSSKIKKDFLTSDVSYVDSKELIYLIGKVRQTDKHRTEIRQTLLSDFDASSISVGGSKVAIVKRPPQ